MQRMDALCMKNYQITSGNIIRVCERPKQTQQDATQRTTV